MRGLLLCACSGFALISLGAPAAAQSTQIEPKQDAGSTEGAIAPAVARADVAPASSDIVVTGSRLIRGDYSSISPIVTINSQTLQSAGAAGTVTTALSQLPQFTPMATPSSQTFPNRLGQSLLNLRGLGAERFLMLLDGRRIQPSNSDGTVDANFIPSALVRSVETITGGASATYGSDAITGVVNFRLRDDVRGLEIHTQYNQPQIGGGDSENVNAIWGSKLADDRGKVIFSFDYTRAGSVIFAGKRDFYKYSRLQSVTPNAVISFGSNLPSVSAINAVFGGYGAAPGAISNSRPIGVNYDGSLYTAAPLTSPVFNYKGPGDEANVVIIGNQVQDAAGRDYALTTRLDRYNGFGHVDYEVTSTIKVFAEAFYTHGRAVVPGAYDGFGLAGFNGTMSTANPFIPDDLHALLASRSTPDGPISFSYALTSMPGITYTTDSDVAQIVGGLSGSIPSLDWHWDLYGSYGKTTVNQTVNGFSLLAANTLLNAGDGGASLCSGGLNVFGPPDAISQSCRDYIARSGTIRSRYGQSVIEGSVRGGIVDLPAGKAQFAAGVTRRWNSYAQRPSDALQIATNVVPQAVMLPSRGSETVTEGFVELLVPILHDMPLIKSFQVDLGYRYSNYKLFGGVSTYNASADWEVVSSLRLRGGYARAIRAPSLADLFTPSSSVASQLGTPSATSSSGDPCDVRSRFRTGTSAEKVRALCIAQGVPAAAVDTYTFRNVSVFPTAKGNTNLDPEVADTYTAGAVWRSEFDAPLLSRLQLSVDYYNIKVRDAIGTLPFNTALTNCFNADNLSNPNYDASNRYCSFIRRNGIGEISSDSVIPRINQATYATSGIDFQLDWQAGLGALGLDDKYGSLAVNFVGTWLDKFVVQSFANAPKLDYSGSTSGSIVTSVLPKWKSVTRVTYSIDTIDLGLRWRHLSGVKDVSKVTTVNSTTPGVPSVDYFDLNFNWRMRDNITLNAGVTDLFSHSIPQVGPVIGTTDPNTYNIVGRSYYLGVGVKF